METTFSEPVEQLLLLQCEHPKVMLSALGLSQSQQLPSFSALGGAGIRPLVGEGANRYTPKGKHVHFVTELGRNLKHLGRHEGLSACRRQ